MKGPVVTSRSLHLVDPELLPALNPYPYTDRPEESLEAVRATLERVLAAAPVDDDLSVRRDEVSIPGPPGAPAVRALVYRPAHGRGPWPAALHIHGGGYVVGSPDFADLSNRRLVAELACVVCSVDYRLAPEHPHPAPVQDCMAALRWIHDQADSLQADRTRIGLKGESAGGGLAAALALLWRDGGGPALRFQHLTYPMLDDRTCVSRDPHPYTGEFVWTPERNHFGWSALLGQPPGGPDISAYAAAARALDLTRLPPAFISVGMLDLFLEESLEYARRLIRAGVPVELHVYPGAFHGFGLAAQARTSVAAARDSLEWLRRVMSG